MARLTPHWEATAPGVEAAFRTVSAALAGSDFYLAGGTALALQYGHRISVDLDLFSPSLIDADDLSRRIDACLPGALVTSVAPRTVELSVLGVPVSLFGYSYPLVSPLECVDEAFLPLAGAEDIAAMKLAAIASRGSRKDFVDLWLILRQGRTLAQCLESFGRKFQTRDVGHVLRSLTYFDDAEREPAPRLLVRATWQDIKRDLSLAATDHFDR